MAPNRRGELEHSAVRPLSRAKPGLLKPERRIFAERGFGTVRSMENALVDIVRKALADASAV
jgi:para-nitrobenzyl esterase